MTDDTTKHSAPDRIRINVKQVHERSYWCARFGVTRPMLKLAVKAVGPMVKDVKKFLIARITNA